MTSHADTTNNIAALSTAQHQIMQSMSYSTLPAFCVQDEKHLTRITPKLKTRYKLHPRGQPENTSAGVNMALLAYAGPYKAIGQSIR